MTRSTVHSGNCTENLADQHGKFVVYDLHTYNHRRDGATGTPADPTANPQVNVGTGTMDRERWGSVVDAFLESLRSFDFPGGKLDVRENVKFFGGQHPKWAHEKFPTSACVIAVEFKKFFMDEWSGKSDEASIEAIGDALRFTVPSVLDAIKRV